MRLWNKSLGIDFRDESIRIISLSRGIFGFRILNHCILENNQNVGESSADNFDSLLKDIKKILIDNRIRHRNIFISIPRSKGFIKIIDLPQMNKKKLGEFMECEIDGYFPLSAEKLYFDFKILKKNKDGHLKVLLIAVKRDIVDLYIKGFLQAGICIKGISLASVANLQFYRQFIIKSNDKTRIFLIESSKDYLEINVLMGKEWQDSIAFPAGDSYAAEPEQEDCVDGFFSREEYKNSPVKLYSLRYNESPLIEKIEEKLNTRLIRANLDSIIKRGNIENEEPHLFVTSAGLALNGLSRDSLKVNLFPRHPKRKINPKPFVRGFLVVSIIILSLLSGFYMKNSIKERQKLVSLKIEVNRLSPEIDSVEKMSKNSENLKATMIFLEKLKNKDVSKLELLRELSMIIPLDTHLTSLSYKRGAVDMSGYSQSSRRLISILERSPMLKDAQFDGNIVKEGEKERFKIRVVIE